MKRIVSASAFVLLGSVSAFAADMPVKTPAYQAPAIFNWTGVYGGISGGYGFGKNDVVDGFQPLAFFGQRYDPQGGFGGLQFGYNSQFAPHWLIGTEFDLSFGDLSDGSGLLKDKFDWFGTARTRFGYVQDRTLLYLTGGAIWVREKERFALAAPVGPVGPVSQDTTDYHVGWVVGGGVEYAVDPRWSWKLEYLYAPFGSTSWVLGSTRSSDPTLQIVRAGVNYRFGDGGASSSYMPVKAARPRSTWNGSYIGAHGGFGWAKFEEEFTGTQGPITGFTRFPLKPDGFFGGIQGGYNWVFAPQWLLGIEVDSSWGDLKGTGPLVNVSNGVPTTVSPGTSGKVDDLGTARFRLGYIVNDVLYYATGGVAYAETKQTDILGGNTKLDHLGWVAGGGVEWKFTPDWSLKAEYDYADFADYRINGPAGTAGLSVALTQKSTLSLQTVKVGLNYYGPVIERFFGGK